jgi:hypothetical protein
LSARINPVSTKPLQVTIRIGTEELVVPANPMAHQSQALLSGDPLAGWVIICMFGARLAEKRRYATLLTSI